MNKITRMMSLMLVLALFLSVCSPDLRRRREQLWKIWI